MTKLILIRHSISKQQSGVNSHQWTLTKEGKKLCKFLAEQLRAYAISCIYTSKETKAYLTGKIVADALNIPCKKMSNLEETHRKTVPYYDNVQEFKAAIKNAMRNPDELLFGEETFTDARKRLATQIDSLLAQHSKETLAIVSHATVLSVYLGHIWKRDPVEIWDAMAMPAYIVLSLPDKKLLKIVNRLEDEI